MEQRFFDSISDEQQDKNREAMEKLLDSIPREDRSRETIKASYTRRLAERLKAKA